MTKKKTNFWIGLALGGLGGVIAAKKQMEAQRMPNAKIWQRILAEKMGMIEAAVFIARVQFRYRELMARRPIFDHPVFDTHVTGNVLPGLALYQTWREEGLSQEKAIEEVDHIFEAWFHQFPPVNMLATRWMKYAPDNFALFRRLVRWVTEKFFPPPGWQYEYVEDNEDSFAFNMHHCFYLDVLTYYQAPELTPVFCKLDDVLMAVMPQSIRWGRTQTIGLGADCCDFRWDYVPADAVESNGWG